MAALNCISYRDESGAKNDLTYMAPLSIAALKLQMSDVIRAQPLPPEMLVQSKNRAADLLKSADYKEGISALREKRHPKFKGV